MTHYLNKTYNWQTTEITDIMDELSLWSAHFGITLLDYLPLKHNCKILDIGFGNGFPLIELAQRFGSSSKIYGVDIWHAAVERTRRKIEILKIENIEVNEADASNIPFNTGFFDMVVTNIGINNFENKQEVLHEVYRILKPNGTFVITTNTDKTFKEFYEIFHETIIELGLKAIEEKLEVHIKSRMNSGILEAHLETTGFSISKTLHEAFFLRFLDGTALLNHAFINIAFLQEWKKLIPQENRESFFTALENKLNKRAKRFGELKLSVPVIYIQGEKQT